MKKSTNISIVLKSGIEAQVSIIREQGYEKVANSFDGMPIETTEYKDHSEIKVTIAKVGIIDAYAHLDGSILCTTRRVGNKTQAVKAQISDEDARNIAQLSEEILSTDDKAVYDAKIEAGRKADAEYEQHRNNMRKVMGY